MSKTVLGFDIGTCELKIVQWDGSSVRRAVMADMPDNLVKNGVIISYPAMADFIKETVAKRRLSGRSCAVILPASHAFLQRVTVPAMTEEQLLVNLPYEFRDFLTMGKDKYYYDYVVNSLDSGEDGEPKVLNLTAAAVPKEVINDYRAMFRRAGLRLSTAIPVECAYSNLLRARGDIQGREFSFLDLGHTAARLHIFTGARFEATRVIGIGLSNVDEAIADAMSVDEHVARTYKHADHQGAQTLEPAVDVYNAIALDVRKAINFYSFSNRDSALGDLWGGGGGVHIPALKQAIGQSVELTLHTVDELLPPAAQDVEDLNAYAAAIGAAMQ